MSPSLVNQGGNMAPLKSEAQRRKFNELVKQGKMKQSTLDAWEAETPKEKLPEYVAPKTLADLKRAYARKYKK